MRVRVSRIECRSPAHTTIEPFDGEILSPVIIGEKMRILKEENGSSDSCSLFITTPVVDIHELGIGFGVVTGNSTYEVVPFSDDLDDKNPITSIKI